MKRRLEGLSGSKLLNGLGWAVFLAVFVPCAALFLAVAWLFMRPGGREPINKYAPPYGEEVER